MAYHLYLRDSRNMQGERKLLGLLFSSWGSNGKPREAHRKGCPPQLLGREQQKGDLHGVGPYMR